MAANRPNVMLPACVAETHTVQVMKDTKRQYLSQLPIEEARSIISKGDKVDSALCSAVFAFIADVASNNAHFSKTQDNKPSESMKLAMNAVSEAAFGDAFSWSGSLATYKSIAINAIASGVSLLSEKEGYFHGPKTLQLLTKQARGVQGVDYTKRVTALAKCAEDSDAIAGIMGANVEDWRRVVALAVEALGPSNVESIVQDYRAASLTQEAQVEE